MSSDGQTRERPGARIAAFYLIVAAISVAVVILVVHHGRKETALPAIAGGYDASTANACLGPPPPPAKGAPLPATAPAQVPPSGPSFNILQSGQFVNVTNNQGTLSGQLRLDYDAGPGGAHRLSGTIDCVSGGPHLKLDALATGGTKGSILGTLGGAGFAAAFKREPPAPGSPAPRTPSGIGGHYSLAPSSTCFGGAFVLGGDGPTYRLTAGGQALGSVAYSKATGAIFGDVGCVKGGHVRMSGTANDLKLQNVQLIPLDTALPAKTSATASASTKPALTTPSGLPPWGEKISATKVRPEFGKLVAALFIAVAVVLILCRLLGIAATKVGQPRVMGEVIAGVVLGPSVLGAISANLQASIFPSDILPPFGVAANLGLIFYMFLVGLEVDRDQLKGKATQAAVISNASVALPMLLGIAAALPLYKLLGPDKKFVAFALFMGVSMSITAFPVLARILTERRMLKRAGRGAHDRLRGDRRRDRLVPDRAGDDDRRRRHLRRRRQDDRRGDRLHAVHGARRAAAARRASRPRSTRSGASPPAGSRRSSSACCCPPTSPRRSASR